MYSVTITFKDKKTLNRFKRNLKNGKGTNIKPSDIHGDGIFDSLKSVANSQITKAVVKAVAPAIVNAVGSKTGPVGSALANGAINAYTGSGFVDTMKKIGKSKILKAVAKEVAPVVGKTVSGLSGSDLAGSVVNTGLASYGGSGVGKSRVVQQSGVALPAGVMPNIDPVNDLKATMQARMARIRGFKKKRGGSVLPLGSR
jgi:hypothetical protein